MLFSRITFCRKEPCGLVLFCRTLNYSTFIFNRTAPCYSTIGNLEIPGSHATSSELADLIIEHTEVSRNHLTPEIRLHLITPSCKLWTAAANAVPFTDPFWAFYWPGGQAVSRYILDHPLMVRGARILDVGSGSGACAIAAAMSGASHVTANDIDPVAGVSCLLNARLNGVNIDISTDNLVDNDCHTSAWDCVLLGDMFYDEEFASRLLAWIKTRRGYVCLLVGDPGRLPLVDACKNFTCIAEYALPENVCRENNGFRNACVWQLRS